MKITLLIIAILLLAVPAVAQQVTFAWDPHPEAAQITGFKLYQSKQSTSYGAIPAGTFTGGNLTTGSIPKPGLGRFYFVLTAYVTEGGTDIESGYSNEVSLVLKPKSPNLLSATLMAVITAPVKAVKWLWASGEHKSLRIVK